MILTRKANRALRERFPDVDTKGSTTYLLMRSLQLRRLRIPKARVKRGDPEPPLPR
jgi:Protein of unknown function (DUF3043)